MSRSITLLAAFLAAVSAIPVQEKRADYVTATINGQVVSWENNWSGVATNAPAATANPQQGGEWITATYNGQTFSWQNAPVTATAPVAAPATSTAAAQTSAPAASSPSRASNTDASCKDVHIFLSRGWNEPYPGRQGKLAGAICYGIESCDYEDIQFITNESSGYCDSVNEGDVNGVNQMNAYAAKCPASKLVLTGYSLGANVAGDVLGGGGGNFGQPSCYIDQHPGLDPNSGAGKQLGAALLFGDNRHVANQPYNVLNGSGISTDNPRFPDSLANMNRFAGVMRSYCDESDPVCASMGPGPFIVDNHLNYFDRYSDDAAGWVKYMLGY